MTTISPPETLLALSSAHVDARALHVAAELGVADVLGDEPRTADELAADLEIDADALHRVLRLLESYSIFSIDSSARWQHTEASRWLRSDHPRSLRSFARMSASPFSWGSLTHLDHAVRSGEAGICRLHAGGWTAYLEANPRDREIFQQAMTAKAHDDIAAVLASYDFSRHRRIADVGGGQGHLLAAVLEAHPSVEGVLFELPSVAARVPETDRLEVLGGDFFQDPLPTCDAYVLMNVIHDWNDKDASEILRAVSAAADGTATVLLLEVVLPGGPEHHWGKTLDVMMLGITGGRERTLPQYQALLGAAGIELVAVTPTATPFSVIEGRVAAG